VYDNVAYRQCSEFLCVYDEKKNCLYSSAQNAMPNPDSKSWTIVVKMNKIRLIEDGLRQAPQVNSIYPKSFINE